MNDTLPKEARSRDPQVGLRAVLALRRLHERLEALQVRSARQAGWTWEQIGRELGVSKQAVHRKYSWIDEIKGK